MNARPQRGFTLSETLVALALGAFLVLAIAKLIASAGRAMAVRDSLSELRERGRYALAALEPEVQMAGLYGLSTRAADIRWMQAGNADASLPAGSLSQSATPVAGAPAAAHECGVNFVLDVVTAVQADNGRFTLGRNRSASCAASGGARPGADTLSLRRAATVAGAADEGRFQLLVDRSDERRRWLLADGLAPSGITAATGRIEWHDLQAMAYYISNDSVGAAGTPALRVKSLTRVAGRPAWVDTEVMPGVEDLQVQFIADEGRFDPGALPPGAHVRMIQVWLRLRATHIEPGYRDDRIYRYADVAAPPAAAERGYRRLLLTRRIALRDASP